MNASTLADPAPSPPRGRLAFPWLGAWTVVVFGLTGAPGEVFAAGTHLAEEDTSVEAPTPHPSAAPAGAVLPAAGLEVKELAPRLRASRRSNSTRAAVPHLRALEGEQSRIRAVMRLRCGFAQALASASAGGESVRATTLPPPSPVRC